MTDIIRLGARLRAARKAAGFKTSKEFLKKHRVPASTWSQYESGARLPDDEILKSYSKIFAVSFDWLKTGKGKPYKQLTTTKQAVMAEELADIGKWKINQELLSDILEKLLKNRAPQLTASMIKKVSADAANIYTKMLASTASSKTQKKVLNAHLK